MTVSRTLPSAPEAEASLLGTMMVYPNATRIAMEEGLNEDDFFVTGNRTIFLAMQKLYQTGKPVDLTTVSALLSAQNALEKCGGIQYLMTLSDAAVTSANTKNYVAIIHDRAIMRNMIEATMRIAEDGMKDQSDVDAYLDQAEKEILNISRARRTTEFTSSTELMGNVLDIIRTRSENTSGITGLKTGLRDLDQITHGFQKGDFIVLAARPSMGKTAVALNLAMRAAMHQKGQGAIAIFSLEMASEQLGMRLLSARSRVPGDKILTGRLTNDDWNRVNEAASELQSTSLYFDSTSGIKMPEIFSKCRKLQADQGLLMVVIDYIQLIEGSSSRRNENRQQEVSEISRNLKALAREMNVPVLALSQLARSVEQRPDKHPLLSDLRESGAIEQDADIVMMLYRESYYNEEIREAAKDSGTERLEINIEKHRNGAVGKVNVAFEANTSYITTLQYAPEQQGGAA